MAWSLAHRCPGANPRAGPYQVGLGQQWHRSRASRLLGDLQWLLGTNAFAEHRWIATRPVQSDVPTAVTGCSCRIFRRSPLLGWLDVCTWLICVCQSHTGDRPRSWRALPL
ncbi:hypothetical protein FKM82_024471 [Ascaphus truei]